MPARINSMLREWFIYLLCVVLVVVIQYVFMRLKRPIEKVGDMIRGQNPPTSDVPNYEPIPPLTGTGRANARRRKVFQVDHPHGTEDEDVYTSALSVIALFSWVIRRDKIVDHREMSVAWLYFKNHPIYRNLLWCRPKGLQKDPITGDKCLYSSECMELLRHYNASRELLRYDLCCQNILKSGIFYEAALDLLNALFQVAFSSDGVVGSEMEILYGISIGLKIKQEDWKTLKQKYKTAQANKSEEATGKKKSDSSASSKEKKNSSYGYKLTQAYNQLGLLTTASEAEIKNAYRDLVKKYHPDHLSPDATDLDRKISADQFQRVKEAYDLIRLEKGM